MSSRPWTHPLTSKHSGQRTLLWTKSCLNCRKWSPYKVKGAFSTPVCVRKQTNGPPIFTKASLQAAATATVHCQAEQWTHPPPPVPPFLLAQNLSSKRIAPTNNMWPKSDDAKSRHRLVRVNRCFVSIMNFLKEAEYHFYFAGLCLWETSRSRSPALLHLPFSQHSLPGFIKATHECFQRARWMQPCFHQYCKEWYLQVSSKCNYFQDNPDMVVTDKFKNTPHNKKESKRTIPSLENRLPPTKLLKNISQKENTHPQMKI